MTAHNVLMVEPKNFHSNPQTAFDNFFQQESKTLSADRIHEMSMEEFNSLHTKLTAAGIEVTLVRQDDGLDTPDAAFPNNWFSTHPDGTLVIYPMKTENRRLEKRPVIISQLKKKYPRLIDLSFHEDENRFLEGTGSLVIDHQHRIAYASISMRTDPDVLQEWARHMNYELIMFTSRDAHNQIIYHTNVMMTLGHGFAIICLDSIQDRTEKKKVQTKLSATYYELIEISLDQMQRFCGNCLALENKSGEKFLVMSDKAFENFGNEQLRAIENTCTIIHSNLNTIEIYGGGGARCMLAELF